MTRYELNLINMFGAVDQFLVTNAESFTGFDSINESHATVKDLLAHLSELGQTQAMDSKVESLRKSTDLKQLQANTLKVSAALCALAVETNDPALKLKAEVDKWQLKNMRENDQHIKAREIYELAKPLIVKLAKWQVTADDVESLDTLSTSVKQLTPEVRNVKVVTKQATTDVKLKIDEVKTELNEKLDTLMKPFEAINPTLYGQYLNARKVVNRAATRDKADTDTPTE